jgi:hypothetical protein
VKYYNLPRYIYICVCVWGVVAVPHEDMMKQGL